MEYLPLAIMLITILVLGLSSFAGRIDGRRGSWTKGAFLRAGGNARKVNLVMVVLVSLVFMGASLWVILGGLYDADAQRWAYATCGTIVGYWLRKGG